MFFELLLGTLRYFEVLLGTMPNVPTRIETVSIRKLALWTMPNVHF